MHDCMGLSGRRISVCHSKGLWFMRSFNFDGFQPLRIAVFLSFHKIQHTFAFIGTLFNSWFVRSFIFDITRYVITRTFFGYIAICNGSIREFYAFECRLLFESFLWNFPLFKVVDEAWNFVLRKFHMHAPRCLQMAH